MNYLPMIRKIIFSLFLLSFFLIFPNKVYAETKMGNTPAGAGQIIPKIPKTANDPILENGGVYPMWGPVCQRYTYYTTYKDKEGRAPEYVKIYFNGDWIDVEKEDKNNNNYKNGVRYIYKYVPNKLGSNFFFFEASNGIGKTREGIIDSPGNGPVLFEGDFKNNEIALINAETGKKVWRYPTDSAWVSGVALSDDGKYLAALTAKKLYLFDTTSAKPLWTYSVGSQDTPGDVKGGIDISGDGAKIAASMGNTVWFFDKKSNKPLWSTSTGSNSSYSVSISRDGKYVSAGTAGNETDQNSNLIVLWDEKGKKLWQYHASGNFHEVSLSDDGKYVAGATGDITARMLAEEMEKILRDNPNESKVSILVFDNAKGLEQNDRAPHFVIYAPDGQDDDRGGNGGRGRGERTERREPRREEPAAEPSNPLDEPAPERTSRRSTPAPKRETSSRRSASGNGKRGYGNRRSGRR